MPITYSPDDKSFQCLVQMASKVISQGGIIIFPTDTVYGLGVDATNRLAVDKIFELKGRQESRGIASIFKSIDHIKQYAVVTFEPEKILQKYLPGPYTFLLRPKVGSSLAPKLIDAEQNTIGVRLPNYPFTQALVDTLGRPYTATSANHSGLPSPKTAKEVERYMLKYIAMSSQGHRRRQGTKQSLLSLTTSRWARNDMLFINAGTLPGTPSTVVDLTKTPPAVVRWGAGEWDRR